MTFVADKLKGVASHYKADGMRGILDAVRSNIWDRTAFLLLSKQISESELDSQPPDGSVTIREACASDLGMILDSWPREFERVFKTRELLEAGLAKRFKDNVPCFVATDNRCILGAVWCTPWEYTFGNLPHITATNALEITNIFVVPSCRGQRIGSHLLNFSCMRMAKANRTFALSRILPHRVAALKAHYIDGYACLGRITYTTAFGRRSCRFEPTQEAPSPSPAV